MALFVRKAAYLISLLPNINIEITKQIVIFEGNKSCISIATYHVFDLKKKKN